MLSWRGAASAEPNNEVLLYPGRAFPVPTNCRAGDLSVGSDRLAVAIDAWKLSARKAQAFPECASRKLPNNENPSVAKKHLLVELFYRDSSRVDSCARPASQYRRPGTLSPIHPIAFTNPKPWDMIISRPFPRAANPSLPSKQLKLCDFRVVLK